MLINMQAGCSFLLSWIPLLIFQQDPGSASVFSFCFYQCPKLSYPIAHLHLPSIYHWISNLILDASCPRAHWTFPPGCPRRLSSQMYKTPSPDAHHNLLCPNPGDAAVQLAGIQPPAGSTQKLRITPDLFVIHPHPNPCKTYVKSFLNKPYLPPSSSFLLL